MNSLKPLNRRTLSQTVAQEMLNLIRSGKYQIGDKLPSERELMNQLQVGRSCLREAMQGLAMLNIVSIQPGRGTFIQSITSKNIEPFNFELELSKEALTELFEVRFILEVEAAGLAAERLTDNNIHNLNRTLSKLATATGDTICHLSLQIHQLIAESTQNKVMVETLSLINKKLWRYQSTFYSDELKTAEIESHRQLVRGILSHNPQQAKGAMREHLRTTIDSMLG